LFRSAEGFYHVLDDHSSDVDTKFSVSIADAHCEYRVGVRVVSSECGSLESLHGRFQSDRSPKDPPVFPILSSHVRESFGDFPSARFYTVDHSVRPPDCIRNSETESVRYSFWSCRCDNLTGSEPRFVGGETCVSSIRPLWLDSGGCFRLGYCYLSVIKPEFRSQVFVRLGRYPRFEDVIMNIDRLVLDIEAARTSGMFLTAGIGRGAPSLYHLSSGRVRGHRYLGTFLDSIKSALILDPNLNPGLYDPMFGPVCHVDFDAAVGGNDLGHLRRFVGADRSVCD